MNNIRQELHLIGGIGLIFLLIGCGILGDTEDWIIAGQWLLQAGLLWAWVLRFIWNKLALNKASSNTPPYPTLGWGNRLTILRGGLIALTGGFLFLDQESWLPALFYSLAAILDRLDGFIARRSRQVSLLGNELDINFDALGLLVAPLLAVNLGKIHVSYLFLSIAYYLYQWGLQHRRSLNLPINALAPNPLRRTLAGFQMGFIAVALWPLLNPAVTTVASIAFMLPVLFGFAVDWWVICGKLSTQRALNLEGISAQFLQPGLRLLLIGLHLMPTDDAKNASYWQIAFSGHVFEELFCISLVLLGFAGRIGALGLFLLWTWNFYGLHIDLTGKLFIFSTSWLMLLGTGRFSLWQWDDAWVKRYDGA